MSFLRLSPSVSTYTEKREDPYFKASYDNVDYSQIPAGFRGEHESLNDVQKFIEAHPGCTSGDIADALQVTHGSAFCSLQASYVRVGVWLTVVKGIHADISRA